MAVSLSLFGAPTIEFGDATQALEFERRAQVLVYLALKRAWVGRAELAGLLWPGQPSKLALTNLRKALFRLQSSPWAPALEASASALRFDVPTDVQAFEAALREGRLADAIELRGGELLAGFDDLANEAWSNWLHYERDRLRVAWRTAAQERLAGDGLEPSAAVRLASRLVEDDPLDEDALAAYMRSLARGGQGVRARQAYREFEARLKQELGVAPSAELKALNASIGAAPVREATPAPATDDGFIGRAVELRRLTALLAQDGCRLLTITGPGGVGKTRLARRAQQEIAARFADGALFVPLDDVASTDDIPARLAHVLGVPLKGGADPHAAVLAALRERSTLLVLDNFEQLTAAAPVLERLLAECAQLVLLVTSRVRLAVPSEWLFPLDGLPCPEDEDQEHIETFDAARLFLRAARRVDPALVAAVEAPAIIDICRQVDGLPLALELAASWTRVLSCTAIAAELRHGTELLSAIDPAHPPRHGSLDLVFEQSWRLLNDAERQALARLAVFRGGFTAKAGQAVTGAALPVIAALADKSLLRKDGARLHLHPLVQQFAATRLDAMGGRDATEEAHARYFNDRLHQMRREIERGEREALAHLDTEFENCRAAWRWAALHRDTAALSRDVHALTHYCDHRSRLEEGLHLLREAIEVQVDDSALSALLLGKAAHMEYRLDRYDEAMATAARGLALTERDGAADARAQCLKVIGTSLLRLGRLAEARRYLEESRDLSDEVSDLRHRSAILSVLALLQKQMGHYDESLRLSLEALEQQRRLGDVASEALSLNNLAALMLERQEFEAAAEYLKPALALCDAHGLETTRVYVLTNLTGIEMKAGRLDEAERYGRRALEHARAAGNRSNQSFLKLQFVRLALARGDLDAARVDLRDGLQLALGIGRPQLLIEGVHRFAEILTAQGEPALGRSVLQFIMDHPDAGPLERDELQRTLDRFPPPGAVTPAWPGLPLAELSYRIVAEAGAGYAPLIAALRAGR